MADVRFKLSVELVLERNIASKDVEEAVRHAVAELVWSGTGWPSGRLPGLVARSVKVKVDVVGESGVDD